MIPAILRITATERLANSAIRAHVRIMHKCTTTEGHEVRTEDTVSLKKDQTVDSGFDFDVLPGVKAVGRTTLTG